MKDLTKLTSKELVTVHNNLAKKTAGAKPVIRFSDKKAALRRIRLLQRQGMSKTKVKIVGKGKVSVLKKNTPLHKLPANSHTRIIAEPMSRQKIAKMTSLRGRVLSSLLDKGTTIVETEKLLKAFDKELGRSSTNVENRARELLHLVHRYLGYGLKERNGRIYAFTNNE